MNLNMRSLDTTKDGIAINHHVFGHHVFGYKVNGIENNFDCFIYQGRSSFNLEQIQDIDRNRVVETWPINNYVDHENQILPTTPTTSSQLTPTSNSTTLKITSVSSTPTSGGTLTLQGTLKADTFTFQPGYKLTVIFGNGNVDFGSGARDVLDLSQFSSTTVKINLANSAAGGVVYNPGNGSQVLDSITLSDNSQILFEGIETIKFVDTTLNLSVIPNDPLFNQQWNLHIMDVPDAWRFTTGSSKVLIGIEDTGLGTNSSGNIHPDLRPTIFVGNNYLDESSSFSHGTLTQGVIAGASNNGIGIAGINWNSSVENIDVVGNDAGDYNLTTATQALLNQANSQGQRLVVNLSISGGNTSSFEQLIANNQDKALFVIASGNEDQNSLDSPADLASKYSNVIAVGASWGNQDYYGNPTTPGERISYSNWWGSNYGTGLTVMAPSEYISTTATRTTPSSAYDFGYGGDYGSRFNGTSAAVPNVVGVCSLVWSVNPSLTATQVKSILATTAYDLGAPGYDTVYGYGLVNADTAVRRALALARGTA
jgi:serine protease